MAGRHRVRRSETFGVRRWLQVGAASAGMGAAMWGMSLVGPQVGVAAADDNGSPSSSSGSSSATGTSENDAKDTKAAAGESKTSGADDSDDDSDESTKSGSEGSAGNPDATEDEDTESSSDAEEAGNAEEGSNSDSKGTDEDTDAESDTPDTSTDKPISNLVASPTAAASTQPVMEAAAVDDDDDSDEPEREIHPWGMKQEADKAHEWQQNTSDIIEATTANFDLVINSLPLPPEIREALSGTLWTMRRTFFNLAPTMNETLWVTSGEGEISGLAAATDPENDQMVYRIVQGPRYGTVELNDDGSYIYTPTEDFDGVDTFVIAADDLGAHINLFEPFRGAGASTNILVNQDAIEFEFLYNDPQGLFTEERKYALNQSARRLSAYFIVEQKTVLTYTVNSVNIPDGFLASAGSDSSNDTDPGFWGTVVQEKLQTGIDANGAAADGRINWNWAYDWGLYPDVQPNQYDFTSTAMHELVHSFGWTNSISDPPDLEQNNWSTYDKFVTTKDGDSPIDPDTLLWNSAYDDYLTGYDGGLYFTGEEAVAGYGGRPVPLYTPEEWSGGSSVAHLRDDAFYGPNHAMMDHAAASMGPDNITLNPTEVGVLMDLGYTVVAYPWFAYPMPPRVPDEPDEDPETTDETTV